MSTSNKKGLGRGFESLIPTDLLDESFDTTASQDEKISDLRHIKISEIVVDPEQPRKQFDESELNELSESIRIHGVLQPIVVIPHGSKYQIVAGERRYRASKLAGLDKIPALVRTMSGQKKLELSLIENVQRKDLNVMEIATAYQKLRDQFNLSIEEVADRVGKNRNTVSNTYRLLKLPESARKALAEEKLSEGQGKALVSLSVDEIEKVLPVIIKDQWSVRKVEQYVRDLKDGNAPSFHMNHSEGSASAYKNQIDKFSKVFGTDVNIRSTSKGSGRIVITFKDADDFKRIENLISN